jgi:hypothetical protein
VADPGGVRLGSTVSSRVSSPWRSITRISRSAIRIHGTALVGPAEADFVEAAVVAQADLAGVATLSSRTLKCQPAEAPAGLGGRGCACSKGAGVLRPPPPAHSCNAVCGAAIAPSLASGRRSVADERWNRTGMLLRKLRGVCLGKSRSSALRWRRSRLCARGVTGRGRRRGRQALHGPSLTSTRPASTLELRDGGNRRRAPKGHVEPSWPSWSSWPSPPP